VRSFVFDAGRLTARRERLRARRENDTGEVARAKRRVDETRHHQAGARELATQVADVECDYVTDDDPTGEALADSLRDILEARRSRQHRS